MGKINFFFKSTSKKIADLKYEISLDKRCIEELPIIQAEKEEMFIKEETLKLRKRLFENKLRAYGKHELYYKEREAKKSKFLEENDLKIRYYKQKYARSKKRTKDSKYLKYLEIKLQDKLIKLGVEKTKYLDNIDFTYGNLVQSNKPDLEYQEEYIALEKQAYDDLKQRTFEFSKKLTDITERKTLKAKLRIKVLESKLEGLLKKEQFEIEAFKYLDDKVVLKVEDLTINFNNVNVLDNLNFKVKDKEIFGLIGPNGAGKTTVINCITSFYKPLQGNIYFNNILNKEINLKNLRVDDVIRNGIARTFQKVVFIEELSILDNLLIAGHSVYRSTLLGQIFRTAKYKKEEFILKRRAEDVLKYLGLESFREEFPLNLAYGDLKKIDLARVLMSRPKLIILDSPTVGLNDEEILWFSEALIKINKDYASTIFIVENKLNSLMDNCDNICVIDFGKLICLGKPSEVRNNALFKKVYLGGTEND